MNIKHPYIATIRRALPNDISSETQKYRDVITVQCDIETEFKGKDDVYNYTHKVWIWNDAELTFNGVKMKWSQYLSLADRIPLEVGMYVVAKVYDKTISGQIKLYSPSSKGVMLETDTNTM